MDTLAMVEVTLVYGGYVAVSTKRIIKYKNPNGYLWVPILAKHPECISPRLRGFSRS